MAIFAATKNADALAVFDQQRAVFAADQPRRIGVAIERDIARHLESELALGVVSVKGFEKADHPFAHRISADEFRLARHLKHHIVGQQRRYSLGHIAVDGVHIGAVKCCAVSFRSLHPHAPLAAI